HSIRSLHEFRPADHTAFRVAELGLCAQRVHLCRNEPARYLSARSGACRCLRADDRGRPDKQHPPGDEREGLRARGPFPASAPGADQVDRFGRPRGRAPPRFHGVPHLQRKRNAPDHRSEAPLRRTRRGRGQPTSLISQVTRTAGVADIADPYAPREPGPHVPCSTRVFSGSEPWATTGPPRSPAAAESASSAAGAAPPIPLRGRRSPVYVEPLPPPTAHPSRAVR